MRHELPATNLDSLLLVEDHEQRTMSRLELEVEVMLEDDATFYMGVTENVSNAGLFVATRATSPEGSHVTISFTVPELMRRVEVECEVRWTREAMPDEHMPPGMGLRFVRMNELDGAALRGFLRVYGAAIEQTRA